MTQPRDYYEVLGVDRGAPQDEIRRAFRRLARRHHPDVNPDDPEAERRFREAAEAYEVLGDPARRSQYDRFGHAGVRPGAAGAGDLWEEFAGFESLFDAFFGQRPPHGRTRSRRGSDLRYDLEITLEDVLTGLDTTVRAERVQVCESCRGSGSRTDAGEQPCRHCAGSGQIQHIASTPFGRLSTVATCRVCRGEGSVLADPCPDCAGAGRRLGEATIPVHIPAGIEGGASVRVEGAGEAGQRGAPPGDLYVFVHVKPHEVFERRNRDLFCEIPIAFPTAALGGEIVVPTLNGQEALSVPAGTQSGGELTIRGLGLPDVNTGVRGSLRVTVRVATPTKLTRRQRELLAEYAREGGDEVEADKGWFARFRDALRGEE